MRVAVMGAGAVGCYYGAMLARAGQDVVLIGRPLHVQAVQQHGLRLQTQALDVQVPMAACTEPTAVIGADVVLFCVKSPDTAAAGQALAPHLAPHTVLLCLQNGVDNAERLRAVVPQEVAAAVVYVATEMAGPGHVRHHGRGELVIAPCSIADELVADFAAAGVPVSISGNVQGALWAKLVLNCAWNALSAITRLPYGALAQGDGVRPLLDQVVDECMAVAAAEHVVMEGDVRAAVLRIAETMPSQSSSTAQDLARGRPTEIAHLNGLVVQRGQAHGIATPVNAALTTLVRLLEQRGG
jgi:2-dehydropantoate 2-reductase